MMKLLSYHIENYGKIHDQDGDFSSGLTCFCEKNGFGKSTLASFIKAMFYGLPSYTVASKGFNDRQRYYPFEGGKFGGNLTFESGGKVYRIERFFDKKSAKGDECKVYQNGVIFDGFGEEIGKTLFGLDEESFKKTVFITADEIEIFSTHSINEKLNRTVESAGEDNDFEAAMGALEKARKELKAARGNNDKISEKKREIAELTAQIKNLQDMGDTLSAEYVERERLTGEISALDTQLKSARERNLVLQKWETFDTMTSQKTAKEGALQTLREKYPLGLPSEEERAKLQDDWQKINLVSGALQSANLSPEKETALRELERKFTNGIPMDETIAEKQAEINRLAALETEKNRLLQTELSEREKQLQKKFSGGVPSENELKEKRALLEEYKRKDNALKELSASLLKAKTPTKRNNLKWYFFVLAIALLGAGVGLLFVIQMLGIGFLIAGGIFLVVGIVLSSMNASMLPSNVHFDGASLQAEIKLLEEKLRAFTVPYGYYSEAGVVYDFSVLEEDLRSYKILLDTVTQRRAQTETIAKEAETLRGEISTFLQSYGEEAENPQSGLNRLTASIVAYQNAQADKWSAKQRSDALSGQLETLKNGVSALLEKYGLGAYVATMDGLKGLEVDTKTILDLTRELHTLEKELSDYRERNGLTERPQAEEGNADELHVRLSKLRKDLADCDKRIAETERFVEKLPDAENALLLAEEKLKEYKEKYDLLVDTIDALQGAEQTLKDKYIAPIKERFSTYAEALERVLDEKIGMDQDFRIVFERGGEARSDKHLSAGERSLCALCLRLALIDNMYETEQPFIVMDDPFVHLDETHMARTKALVGELSRDRQIVYFCCHESRRI